MNSSETVAFFWYVSLEVMKTSGGRRLNKLDCFKLLCFYIFKDIDTFYNCFLACSRWVRNVAGAEHVAILHSERVGQLVYANLLLPFCNGIVNAFSLTPR
jgi:hypothetical protein